MFSAKTHGPPETSRPVPHGLARSLVEGDSSRLVTLITTRLFMDKPNVPKKESKRENKRVRE